MSRTHYSITLKFSAVQPKWTLNKTMSAFFLIICRSSGIKHSFRMWLNDNSCRDRSAHFPETAKKLETMRHRKINSLRTWSLRKGRIFKWNCVIFVAKVWIRKLFISNPKNFIYLLWPCRVLILIFFAKITRGGYVFCCSSRISFNPTSYLKNNISATVNLSSIH